MSAFIPTFEYVPLLETSSYIAIFLTVATSIIHAYSWENWLGMENLVQTSLRSKQHCSISKEPLQWYSQVNCWDRAHGWHEGHKASSTDIAWEANRQQGILVLAKLRSFVRWLRRVCKVFVPERIRVRCESISVHWVGGSKRKKNEAWLKQLFKCRSCLSYQ